MELQICSYCGGNIVGGEFCQHCNSSYKNSPLDPLVMTGEAREKELNLLLFSPMCVPIGVVLKRIYSLVGRKVGYGEITFNRQGLLREAYNNGNV